MVKLRFDNLTMSQFSSFSFAHKRKRANAYNKKLTTTLVKGVCVLINEEYNIKIDVKELKPGIIDKGQPDILCLPFTEESYNLKGVISVFDRCLNSRGGYTRYIRNETVCKFFPGSEEKYVPFCPGWVCNGYIIRRNGKLMFDFNDCLVPEGYHEFNKEDDEEV